MRWSKARLEEVVDDFATKTLRNLYDFGDSWGHPVKIERLIDAEFGKLYPRLIEAKGRHPPEDVGGPWGYAELLEAIHDPTRERNAELREWIPDDFGDIAERATAVALARKTMDTKAHR
jgi:hypothetical protein